MENDAKIQELEKRSKEIAETLITNRENFDELVHERNVISVQIKKLQERITKKTYMEEKSVREWI